LENRTEKSKRQLLDDCLDSDLAATLSTDERVTQDTPIRGANGCLERLREFFLEDHPSFLCRHLFQECVQSQGESFKIWWTKKQAKAKECNLDKVNKDEMMMLEVIRGVSDPKLRERFLQEKDPTLSSLVGIAGRWQMACDVQSVLGIDDAHNRKAAAANYKARQAAKWQQERPQSVETCPQCGGRGNKMHSREQCPAKEAECFECHKVGHYGQVCRSKGRSESPKKEAGDAAARSVQTAEVQGHGGSDPFSYDE
jgi:hypothetical protein